MTREGGLPRHCRSDKDSANGLHTRRDLIRLGAAGAASWLAGVPVGGQAPVEETRMLRRVDTSVLTIGFEESGRPDGFPVILLHGFPDDVRAWDAVAAHLAREGRRVLVPYLRGHGATRYRDPTALRTGEQAAIGQDLLDLADALSLRQFAVAGYDWGGRAACIAAALHPDRVRAAVIIGGYAIQDTVSLSRPAAPEREQALWYQWYFSTERGRAGLAANRRSLCRLLWKLWSPMWTFQESEFDATAPSFDNPDFVDVVIHSYRHRHGYAAGEARFLEVERLLARRPRIAAPTVVLYGADDGVAGPPPPNDTFDRRMFENLIDRQIVPRVGHFLPREDPGAVSAALTRVLRTWA
ncbi:MAG: alpha/beta hydrolase [Vicinamibacterales bacterium]